MFYSDVVLARKGPLANIWMAAHLERKLTKAQIVHTDIQSSVGKTRDYFISFLTFISFF